MAWQVHQVVFRVRSPLHIGSGKVGNLQRTYPYVTGRVLWGALTMRLTRDAANGRGAASDSQGYQVVGEEVHESLAYTYFYPATWSEKEKRCAVAWAWEDESGFRRRFLSSYASTALAYPQQAAAEGMLHEVEFISPQTLDTGEPVVLLGYVFVRDGCKLTWQSACTRLQLGGERGYGWGDVELVDTSRIADGRLFEGKVKSNVKGERPVISMEATPTTLACLLAHSEPAGLSAAGKLEPLVGREWRSNNTSNRHAGQHVEYVSACFAPGSQIDQPADFEILKFGVWRPSSARGSMLAA